MILGFDPRYQFVHEDDVVHALEHVVKGRLPGVYNVAADGVLALSEVAGLLGKPYAPILPPWGTGLAASVMRRVGLSIPPEMLNQLRFGRGVDNRRLKATGFEYGYTSREAVIALGEHMRLHPLMRGSAEPYRYEREVEEFLRWSPNVRRHREAPSKGRKSTVDGRQSTEPEPQPAAPPPPVAEPASLGPPVDHYDDLASEEIVSLLGSLEPPDLVALRDYERGHAGRQAVLGAIDSVLARASGSPLGA
jgi:UDP-glucose 4-epimerase